MSALFGGGAPPLLDPGVNWRVVVKQEQARLKGEAEREGRVLAKIESLRIEREARARFTAEESGAAGPGRAPADLRPFLDGTYEPPRPSVGATREDGAHLLYPGLWHTCIGLTTAGKSWFGLWHAVAVLRAGGTVAYAHFEETSPNGTLDRLRKMAPDITDNVINGQFWWLPCETAWKPGEFAASVPAHAALVILDGINAACTQHGWVVNDPEAVGAYRARFVTPVAARNAAVLSLGHPPKAKDRQDERHSFGASGWLDEVNGVGFRMVAAKKGPIRRGRKGSSAVYSVKDRPGQVELNGQEDGPTSNEGWLYLGSLRVDDSGELLDATTLNTRPITQVMMSVPEPPAAEGMVADPVARLGGEILRVLVAGPMQFNSKAQLEGMLHGAGVKFDKNITRGAIERLISEGHLVPKPTRGNGVAAWHSALRENEREPENVLIT